MHGSPSNPYSQENIAKRLRREEQTRRDKETRRQADQPENLRPRQRTVQPADNNNVRGYMNSREIGPSKTVHDRENLEVKLIQRQKVWKIHQSQSENPVDRLTSFIVDEDSGNAVLGTHSGLVSTMSTRSTRTHTDPPTPATSTTTHHFHEPKVPVTRFAAPVSSISLSDTYDHKTLVSCFLGNEHTPGTIHVGKFLPTEEDGSYGHLYYLIIQPRKVQSLFCTAISRYNPNIFAVGGEDIIFISTRLHERVPTVHINSNCFAVEFLGENTLAAGSRNGIIR